MGKFSVTEMVRNGCQIVAAAGDLDADAVPQLELALDHLGALMPVIIDLLHVTSLTSAGVQALLRERSFGQPALVCPQGTIASRVLEIVHADLLVPIYQDLDAAIGAAAASA